MAIWKIAKKQNSIYAVTVTIKRNLPLWKKNINRKKRYLIAVTIPSLTFKWQEPGKRRDEMFKKEKEGVQGKSQALWQTELGI